MQFSQEDADLRLLRTPFSICWSSLTEIALSCEHRHGHHKIIKPLLSASLTTNVAQVKKWFKLIKKTFWMQLLLGLTSPASWSNSLLRPFSSSVSSAGRLGGGGWEQTHSVSTSRAEGFSDPGWTTYLREVRVHGAAHLSVGENLTWVKKIPRCCSGAGNLTLTQLQPSSRRTSWPGSLPRGGAGRWWAPAGILQEAAWIALTPPVCWCTSCCGPSTHGSGRSLSMLVPHSPEPPKAITGTFIVLKIIRREEERRWHVVDRKLWSAAEREGVGILSDLIHGEADGFHVQAFLPQLSSVLLHQGDHHAAHVIIIISILQLQLELRITPKRVCRLKV